MLGASRRFIAGCACFIVVVSLAACGGGGSSAQPQPQPQPQPPPAVTAPGVVAPPLPAPVAVQEVPGAPVKIVMIVSSAQMQANGTKVRRFAEVLVSDLNRRALARSGSHATVHSVDVVLAGPDARSVAAS